jgi:hypothetical protein
MHVVEVEEPRPTNKTPRILTFSRYRFSSVFMPDRCASRIDTLNKYRKPHVRDASLSLHVVGRSINYLQLVVVLILIINHHS